jgi:hypothetical protein
MSEKRGLLPDAVAIEREVDSNCDRAGPWARVVNEIRALPIAERRSVAENLSRMSRKLHQRSGRSTVSVPAGYLAELGLAIAGAVVLALGTRRQSNLLITVLRTIAVSAACQSHRRLPARRSLRVCVSLWVRNAVQDVFRPVPGAAALRATAVASVRDDRLSDWRLGCRPGSSTRLAYRHLRLLGVF